MPKWMQAASKRIEQRGTKGALHRDLGIPEDKPIPSSRINSELSSLHKKAEGDKKLTQSERLRLRRLQFAKAAKK